MRSKASTRLPLAASENPSALKFQPSSSKPLVSPSTVVMVGFFSSTHVGFQTGSIGFGTITSS